VIHKRWLLLRLLAVPPSAWNVGMPQSLLSLRVLPNPLRYLAKEYLSSPVLHLVQRGVEPRPHDRPGRLDAMGSNGNEIRSDYIDLDLRQHQAGPEQSQHGQTVTPGLALDGGSHCRRLESSGARRRYGPRPRLQEDLAERRAQSKHSPLQTLRAQPRIGWHC
jgi:hypothetical protein